ncbi:MAG: AAA family ATPase, partial [Roseibium sp.]|uniref:GumC family protein n=1 Tax=Roseibium sp. TaxID=1936156 RepID=UPI0026377D86
VLLDVISNGYQGGPNSLITDPEFGVKLSKRDKLLAFLRIKDAALPSGEEALGKVLQTLKDAVSVRRQGLTYLIAVEVRSENPQRAAALANAISETYIRNQIELKVVGAIAARDVVQRQIQQAEAMVVTAEANFNDYIFDNINTFISETGRADFGTMRDRIQAIGLERTDAETRLSILDQTLQSRDFGALASALENEAVSALQGQRESLLQQLATSSNNSTEAVNLRAQLTQIENELLNQAKSASSSVRAELSEIEKRGSEMRATLSSEILSSNLPPAILAQIYRLQQVSLNATTQYQALLSRTQTLETEAALQVADSRIVSPAFTPTSSSYPNTKLILAGSFVFALGAGVGFAFLFENFIGGFTNQDQVEAHLRAPVATVIPKQAPVNPTSASVSESVIDSPLSMFAESIRRMRVSMDQAVLKARSGSEDAEITRGKIIMISSALPGEGKSTVALSLARTLALSGFKTLIIDCDLRKPSVHKQLQMEPSNGLADYLKGALDNGDLMDIVKTDERTGLTAVVGARRSDIPTDQLIDRGSFARMISNATSRFEYIILDSPPIEPVVDGLYLAKYADVIAFVIRWATTPQRLCAQSLEKLDEAKRPNAQIVTLLNQQEGKKAGYFTAYSDYYTE